MSRANEIYNYSRSIERELQSIKSDVNYRTIKRYYEHRTALGISLGRQYKCVNTLKLLSRSLKKKFENSSKEDIIRVVAEIEKQKISDWTKKDYKVILKKFYQWLFEFDGDYPSVVKWIRTKNYSNNLKKSDLLTVDEISKMVSKASSLRDKALILVLAESGRRIGEILTLRIGDVEFDNLGARFLVDGKTGKDHVRIISSAPILATWLDNHPFREEKQSPIWVRHSLKKCIPISYATARTILKDCADRAGIKKRVWFHLFRHTKGTQASKILTTPHLCAVMGWRQGSKMPGIYIHLAGEDIDEAQAILNNVKVEKEPEKIIQVKICNRCENQNSSLSKFCNRCGFCFDEKTVIEIDQSRKKIESVFEELIKEPQKLEKVLKILNS